MTEQADEKRITLADLKRWARAGEKFAMLTCYDATTAGWLWRGGMRTLLVGDTAGQVILGHDSTLPVEMDFMVTLTAAVRRGAPNAFVLADMPFGSYQADEAEGFRNAARFLKEGGADMVKLEVDDSFAPLVERLAHGGVPVMAHIGSRPQQVRAEGGYRSAGKTETEGKRLAETASLLVERGAAAVLVEAVPGPVGEKIVAAAQSPASGPVPVIGCGAGPACHGHVVVLQDMLGLTDWQPPFVKRTAELGPQIEEAARAWRDHVASGEYLADGGPYQLR